MRRGYKWINNGDKNNNKQYFRHSIFESAQKGFQRSSIPSLRSLPNVAFKTDLMETNVCLFVAVVPFFLITPFRSSLVHVLKKSCCFCWLVACLLACLVLFLVYPKPPHLSTLSSLVHCMKASTCVRAFL